MPTIISPIVEIEFQAGVFTNVTADVDLTAGIAIQYGRTSEFSAPTVASCSFQLDNRLGKYTPRLQVLNDGTAHPYYPNVLPRKRVRVSNSAGVRFLGYITSWPPLLENGHRAYVVVSANDRQDQLAGVICKPAHIQSMLSDAPVLLFPMTEPAGAPVAYEIAANGQASIVSLNGAGVSSFSFGNAGAGLVPTAEGTTNLVANNCAPSATVKPGVVPVAGWTVESWCGCSTAAFNTVSVIGLASPDGLTQIDLEDNKDGISTSGLLFYCDPVTGNQSIAVPSTGHDGVANHYAITGTDNGTNLTIVAYINGAVLGTMVLASGGNTLWTAGGVMSTFNLTNLPRTYGPQALYNYPLTQARIAMHAAMGNGVKFDMSTGQRVAEYFHWAGVPPLELDVAPGKTFVQSHPTDGKTVVDLCGEMATTEGGGSVAYYLPTGYARFDDRTFRKPGLPTLTLDAVRDLSAAPFTPSFDDLTLVTSSTVSRSGGSSYTYTDRGAVAAFGLSTDTATTYSESDQDTASMAQYRVASQSRPALRLPQFAFDLCTVESSGLAAQWQATVIGTRAQITNLPAGLKAGTTLDLIVEGWTETIGVGSWLVQCDTSPADNPPRFVWDDSTHGRWGITGLTVLNPITATSTSVDIQFTTSPYFTTDSTAYPLQVKIGEEVLTVTGVPSGVHPVLQQTLFVTRGQAGTQAAPQPAGMAVTMFPASAWTL